MASITDALSADGWIDAQPLLPHALTAPGLIRTGATGEVLLEAALGATAPATCFQMCRMRKLICTSPMPRFALEFSTSFTLYMIDRS